MSRKDALEGVLDDWKSQGSGVVTNPGRSSLGMNSNELITTGRKYL